MGDVILLSPRQRPAPHEPLQPAAWELAAILGMASLAALSASTLPLLPALALACRPRSPHA